MSAVLDYYDSNFTPDDKLHREIRNKPKYRDEIVSLNRTILSECCDVEVDEKGAVKLAMNDRNRFAELQKRRQELQLRLIAIDKLVSKLDALFAESDIAVPVKTVQGISAHRLYVHNKTAHEPNARMIKPLEDLEKKALAAWAASGL